MISRFFNTSKPIHSVIIGVLSFIVFALTRNEEVTTNLGLAIIGKELGKYFIILASIFVLDFLVNKNKLTKKNGYEILIYTLLIAAFSPTIQNTNVFVANFFIVLALRRIISLKSNLNIKKKLFDAAFWVCIAALFHFWAILFLLLIVAALILHSIANIKNWIIPIIGILTVAVIVVSYSIIMDNDFGDFYSYVDDISVDFTSYTLQKIVTPIAILSVVAIWSLGYYIMNIKNKQKRLRPSFLLILITFLIGLMVIIVSPQKDSSELLFIFPSLTIILSNCVEAIKKKWLAEVFIWILILLPITASML